MKMSRVHCSGHLNAIRTTERPHQLSTLSPRYTPVLQRPNGLMQPGHNEVEKTSLGFLFFFQNLQIQSLALFVSEMEQDGTFGRRCVLFRN